MACSAELISILCNLQLVWDSNACGIHCSYSSYIPFKSQLANEMLMYSLSVDMFRHFRLASFSVAFTRHFT